MEISDVSPLNISRMRALNRSGLLTLERPIVNAASQRQQRY